MEFDPAAQPQDSAASSSADWTMVLSDFRRAVSNLVLYVLESVPFPAAATHQAVPPPHSGRDKGDGPRQPFDLGDFREEWFFSDPPASLQPLPAALAQLSGRVDHPPLPPPPIQPTPFHPAAKTAAPKRAHKRKSVVVPIAASAAHATV